ncbi:helix-turn-helix domain-containing protein [Nocardioides sp. zg-578]|nr:helix-turn-helix domain-containing protein [Nocardioides marmotae]MTB83141.1 helix-turn-helix domain-containing protein [Nocardioides marmotae]
MTWPVDFLPDRAQTRRVRNVVVLVQDGAEPFGLGSMCEVWAEPYHPEDDNPVFDFKVAAPRPGRVRGASGFDLHVEHGLDVVEQADLVCVCPKRDHLAPSPEVAAAVAAAYERGATVFAHCTAAFVLGEAGLLDGRRCTTHWRHVAELVERFPAAEVDPDVLYVHDGRVVTGAGSAAGLDAALHLLREEFGAATAASAARRMVVPPHRDGGQAQFIAHAVPDCDAETLGPLLSWILENLAADLDVESLARRALMSPRTFARRFRAETGATPHAWVTRQRVLRAEHLLERTDRPVEWIAGEVGFANAATLRHHFARVRGVSPQAYRRQFAC